MRAIATIVGLLALVPRAYATEPLQLSPEDQQKIQKAAVRLVFADGCNRRLDMPELFAEAKESLRRLAHEIEIPDADETTEKMAASIADAPSEKEASGFTLFNPKLCGDLSKAMKEEKKD